MKAVRFLVVTGLATLLIGCGGDDNNGGQTFGSQPPANSLWSQAEYQQAVERCVQFGVQQRFGSDAQMRYYCPCVYNDLAVISTYAQYAQNYRYYENLIRQTSNSFDRCWAEAARR